MYHIEILILNVILVIFPIFLYQFFMVRVTMTPERERRVIGTLCAGSVLFCLALPYQTMHGFIFDLRVIPVVFSFLYGGWQSGLLTFIMFLFGRMLIGGDGFYVSALAFVVTLIPTVWLSRRWNSLSLLVQHVLGVLLVTLAPSMVFVFSFAITPRASHELLGHLSTMWVVNVFTAMIAIQLIHHVKATARLQREMVRSEKLQVISELAASIAHEVRNPMTAARGFSQLLEQSQNLSTKERDYVGMIRSELDRAHHIINDYLSFARPQVEEVQEIELGGQLAQVLRIISPYAALQGVTLTIQAPQQHIFVMGNTGKLTQALVNIVKNSIESHPKNGEVLIKAFERGASAVIQIEDTGGGMTQEQINQLGSPFYSTKTTGTGLGMMATYRIIQAMGGTIRVESAPGRGTTFTVLLPQSDAEA